MLFHLSYRSLSLQTFYLLLFMIRISDSNRGMTAYKAVAVATEPIRNIARAERLELPVNGFGDRRFTN